MPQRYTTVKVTPQLKQMLEEFKIFPDDTHETVIKRLIEFAKSKEKDFFEWLGIDPEIAKLWKKELEKLRKMEKEDETKSRKLRRIEENFKTNSFNNSKLFLSIRKYHF